MRISIGNLNRFNCQPGKKLNEHFWIYEGLWGHFPNNVQVIIANVFSINYGNGRPSNWLKFKIFLVLNSKFLKFKVQLTKLTIEKFISMQINSICNQQCVTTNWQFNYKSQCHKKLKIMSACPAQKPIPKQKQKKSILQTFNLPSSFTAASPFESALLLFFFVWILKNLFKQVPPSKLHSSGLCSEADQMRLHGPQHKRHDSRTLGLWDSRTHSWGRVGRAETEAKLSRCCSRVFGIVLPECSDQRSSWQISARLLHVFWSPSLRVSGIC